MLWVMLIWVMTLGVAWWWLVSQPVPETAPPAATPDPYAAEIDAFRRQVHDWDRRA